MADHALKLSELPSTELSLASSKLFMIFCPFLSAYASSRSSFSKCSPSFVPTLNTCRSSDITSDCGEAPSCVCAHEGSHFPAVGPPAALRLLLPPIADHRSRSVARSSLLSSSLTKLPKILSPCGCWLHCENGSRSSLGILCWPTTQGYSMCVCGHHSYTHLRASVLLPCGWDSISWRQSDTSELLTIWVRRKHPSFAPSRFQLLPMGMPHQRSPREDCRRLVSAWLGEQRPPSPLLEVFLHVFDSVVLRFSVRAAMC